MTNTENQPPIIEGQKTLEVLDFGQFRTIKLVTGFEEPKNITSGQQIEFEVVADDGIPYSKQATVEKVERQNDVVVINGKTKNGNHVQIELNIGDKESAVARYALKKQELKDDSNSEKLKLPTIDYIVTGKGSVYKYLPDGRTQRFKETTGEMNDPQDALVFVPDFEWVKKHASPKLLEKMGDNETLYHEILLEYVQGKGKKNYIVDQKGNRLETNKEIAEAETKGRVFLTFGDDNNVDFSIPVSTKPEVGFNTFDTRKYKRDDGKGYERESHLGNKVVEIVEK